MPKRKFTANPLSNPWKLKTVQGHRTVKLSLGQVVTSNPDVRINFLGIIEQQVQHYSNTAFQASILLEYVILRYMDVVEECQLPDIDFDLTFFRRLLSAVELEGMVLRCSTDEGGIKIHPDLCTYVNDFRRRVTTLLGSNPFPSGGNAAFNGSHQIKTYLAKEFMQNFREHISRLFTKHISPDGLPEVEETVDEAPPVKLGILHLLKAKLEEIERGNAVADDKRRRLFSLTPIRKCRVGYTHCDVMTTLKLLAAQLHIEMHDFFSIRILKLHKKIVQAVLLSINELNLPEIIRTRILIALRIPDGFEHHSAVDLFQFMHRANKDEVDVYGLKLKPRANHITMSITTDGASCSVSWN